MFINSLLNNNYKGNDFLSKKIKPNNKLKYCLQQKLMMII